MREDSGELALHLTHPRRSIRPYADVRRRKKKQNTESKEAESRIAERMREKVASQVQCEEKRETERHKKKKKIDEIKKKVGKSF